MRYIYFLTILIFSCTIPDRKVNEITLSKYLKPKTNKLVYNCTYDSFHASGLRDTIQLEYRTVLVGNDTAYYLSDVSDNNGSGAQLNHFLGSAIIYKNDTLLLASLPYENSPNMLKIEDFKNRIPPNLKISKPIKLTEVKWAFTDSIFLKSFNFEDLSMNDTIIQGCLKLNLMVYDRSSIPDSSYIWLHENYGVVKWIRTTGREEILDLSLL